MPQNRPGALKHQGSTSPPLTTLQKARDGPKAGLCRRCKDLCSLRIAFFGMSTRLLADCNPAPAANDFYPYGVMRSMGGMFWCLLIKRCQERSPPALP